MARHTLKTMKAVRFLRRLQQRGLVRCVQRWQNETKLAKFNRNKVGEKGRVFDAWYLYAARIKAFKKKILKHRIREYCAPCVTAWWLYICKIRKVRIFVYKVLTGQKRRRFRRCARFSVINSRARRLQCWYRCVRARWQLFLLKLHNLCTRLAQGTIGLAGRQATSRIRKNSATAIQSAFRGLLDRRWAVEYRKERRQQFENRIREWHSHMRSAGIRGICKELAKMNKGLVKSDWNFTHSAEFASKLDALQPHQPRLPMADSAVSKKGSVSSSFASIDCMGVKRIPASVSTTRLLFRKLGRHITKEEADMTSRLLHERDRQITLATLVRFLDAGVVYSANDAADGRASLPEVLIRGSHLKVVKLLKHATGKVKKQRRERERDGETATCKCDAGYTGSDCTAIACVPECGAHGACREGKCICQPPFTGISCEAKVCPVGLGMLECSGLGFCGDAGECVCPAGRGGRACEKEACANDCSGNGICLHKRCRCAAGFDGDDCSRPSQRKGVNELQNSACGGECPHNAVCNPQTGKCECQGEDGAGGCNGDTEGTPASKVCGGVGNNDEEAKEERMAKLRACATGCGETCSKKCAGLANVGACETDCNIGCVSKCTSATS